MSDPRVELPEGVVIGEFKPCYVYNRELDLLQWIQKDDVNVSIPLHNVHAADVLKGSDDELTGVQIWGALAAIKAELKEQGYEVSVTKTGDKQ